MNDAMEKDTVARVECPPARDPAVRWFILAAMVLGLAVWCYLDRRALPEAWDAKHINEIAAYLLNNWGPVVLIPIGLVGVGMGIRHLGRTLIADERGIRYGGTEVTWDQIERLDASRLQEKGILCVRYSGDRTLKLDSWKLQNFRELVGLVEANSPSAAREGAGGES